MADIFDTGLIFVLLFGFAIVCGLIQAFQDRKKGYIGDPRQQEAATRAAIAMGLMGVMGSHDDFTGDGES